MGLLTSSCCCHLPTFFGLHFQHTGPWIKLSLTLASISEVQLKRREMNCLMASQWCRQAIHLSYLEPIHSCRRCQHIGNVRTFFRLLWWSSGRWWLHGNSSACNSGCIFGGVWIVVLQALDLIAFQRPIPYYGSSSDCYNLCCWRSDTTLKQCWNSKKTG